MIIRPPIAESKSPLPPLRKGGNVGRLQRYCRQWEVEHVVHEVVHVNWSSPLCEGGTGGICLVQPYNHYLKPASRKLRKQMTDAERVLWSHLRGKQLLDIQFNRQKPLGPYIVDFYAAAVLLVIEVDGSQHLQEEHCKRDATRDLFLHDQGLMVLRYDDRQVLLETEAVLEEICGVCQQRAKRNPPCPPFAKGGT